MGQILTKIAIVLSGLIFCGFMNPIFGLAFMITGLILSSARDAKLARRRQKRMLPGFGAVWFIAFGVVFAFLVLVGGLGGRMPMSAPTALLCVTVASIWVRIISILVEGGVRTLLEVLLGPFIGWDNIALDQVQEQLDNGTWSKRREEGPWPGWYPPDYTGPLNWEYSCPVCRAKARHAIDVCWNCNYGGQQPPLTPLPPINGPAPRTGPVNPRGQNS